MWLVTYGLETIDWSPYILGVTYKFIHLTDEYPVVGTKLVWVPEYINLFLILVSTTLWADLFLIELQRYKSINHGR